jgi:hypothetical protein
VTLCLAAGFHLEFGLVSCCLNAGVLICKKEEEEEEEGIQC